MSRKQIFLIIMIVMMCFGLVGCGNAIPEMTEEQNAMVASYAAGLLLKYDARYQTKLLNAEELAKEEEMQRQIREEAEKKAALEAEKEAKRQEEELAKQAEKNNGGEALVNKNPAEVLGLSGIGVSFNSVDYMDSYPDSGDDVFFALKASDGCKLAVVRLVLTNQTSETQLIDILNKNAKFKVSFNGGDYYNAMMTMLSDDFSVYCGELQPGDSINTVLLLDIKESECVPVESVNMYIKYNGESVKLKL